MANVLKFRSRFDYGDNKKYFDVPSDEQLTDQRYKNTVDLSRIVTIQGDHLFIDNPEEFERNLKLSDYKSMYEDVSSYGNFFDVQVALADATNRFNDLPSTVREKYGNNVGNFLNAIHNAEIESLSAPVVTPTTEVPGVSDTPGDSVKE